MNDKDSHANPCSIIDDFVGQGAAVTGETPRSDRIATSGCTILTEFTDQGQSVRGDTPSAKPTALPRSASQGCEAITTFVDEGAVHATEMRKGAEKHGHGGSVEQAPLSSES
jgi:hypothetical protein